MNCFVAKGGAAGTEREALGGKPRDLKKRESLALRQDKTPLLIQAVFYLGGVMFASRQVMLPAVVMSLPLVMCAPHVFIGKHRITASETSNITMLWHSITAPQAQHH